MADKKDGDRSPPRGPAEWVTLGCACLVLVALVTLILSQVSADDDPASPVARIDGPIRQQDGMFFVPVVVENIGGATATEVQVQAELEIGGTTTTADQTIDFLPGGDDVDLEFVFAMLRSPTFLPRHRLPRADRAR